MHGHNYGFLLHRIAQIDLLWIHNCNGNELFVTLCGVNLMSFLVCALGSCTTNDHSTDLFEQKQLDFVTVLVPFKG